MSEETVNRWRALAGPTGVERVRTLPVAVWGMLMLIATEAALFAALISSYFFLRWEGPDAAGWPPGPIPDPKLLRPTVMVGVLVVSGMTMLVAQGGIRRGRQGVLAGALGVTLALGLAYVGLQIWNWLEKLEDYTPQTDAHGSLDYLLTGAHTAHLAVGLLIGGWVLVRALAGAYRADRRVGVTVAGLYWHFIVLLGIAVYFTVTVTPHW